MASSFKYLNNKQKTCPIESLYNVAIGLCQNDYHLEAQQLLLDGVKSPAFAKMKQDAKYWIILSEISETLQELEKSASYFSIAARHQAQPFQDLMLSFRSFKQRQLHKKNSTQNKNFSTKKTNVDDAESVTILSTPKIQNDDKENSFSFFSPSPVNNRTQRCTPLTNELQDSLMKLDTKYAKKKYHFNSRNEKKNMSVISEGDEMSDLSSVYASPAIEYPPSHPKGKQLKVTVALHDQEKSNHEIKKYGSTILGTYVKQSPLNAKKMGSNLAVSPVRRSIRLLNLKDKNQGAPNEGNMQEMLKKTNYAYTPNPNII